jgi:hypothetical protein
MELWKDTRPGYWLNWGLASATSTCSRRKLKALGLSGSVWGVINARLDVAVELGPYLHAALSHITTVPCPWLLCHKECLL